MSTCDVGLRFLQEKEPYQKKADKDKARYEKEKAAYEKK